MVEWVTRRLGFVPDAVQARVLRARERNGMLNCSRQWGKSTVSAAMAVYEAANFKDSLTVVVSPSARQSAELVRKARGMATRLMRRKLKGDGSNKDSILFPNGSRIVGLPGNDDTIRGFSAVSLLLVDEAARVKDVVYDAVRPMLAVSSGRAWLLSTPRGKRGFFYEEWIDLSNDFERVAVTAEQCARIPAKFLEREKKRMSERIYQQEYCCQFTQQPGGIFDREAVENLVSWECQPLRFS